MVTIQIDQERFKLEKLIKVLRKEAASKGKKSKKRKRIDPKVPSCVCGDSVKRLIGKDKPFTGKDIELGKKR